MQRYLLSPPEGTPTFTHFVSMILALCGTSVLRFSIVADLSKPVPVTDPALAEVPVPMATMNIREQIKCFIFQ